MKNIAVATDLSTRGRLAADRAHSIAQATGANLVLIHAVDEDQPQDFVEASLERARKHLGHYAGQRGNGVATEIDVVAGDIHSALHDAASRAGADLLVVGDHRRNLMRDALSNTMVERLIRLTAIPVLLARLPAERPYQRAVLGVEGHEASELTRVMDLFGSAGPNSLTAVHAFDAAAAGFMASASIPTEQIEQYRQEVAETAYRGIWQNLDEAHRDRLRIRVVEGDAASALQSVATEEQCEIIAVSTHARRGILRMLLGSVSVELIRQATVDVLIVPRIADSR